MDSYEGIAVLGFPRSGTTLLRRCLDSHSWIDCPGETYLLSACARFLQSHPVVGGVAVGVESGLALAGIGKEELFARLRELAFGFRRQRLLAVGKNVWAEKSAIDSFHIEAIDRVFGDHLAFVCMHRHGLDVCASVRDWCEKSEAYPPELHAYIQRHARPLEAFAHAWVDASAQLSSLRQRRADRSIAVAYEDLVRNPESEMKRVLSFLGLDWEDGLVERSFAKPADGFGDWRTYSATPPSTDRIDRWKKLPRPTIGELSSIVNPTLVSLGYEPVPTPVANDPEEALRRYQFGLKLQQAHSARPGDGSNA